MGDRIFVEPEAENGKPVNGVHKNDGVSKDAKAQPPAGQLDIQDRTIIDRDIPPTSDKTDPQLEPDIENIDKALAMLSRPKNPDMNPVLIAKVSDGFVKIIDEAKASTYLPDRIKIKIDSVSMRFVTFSRKVKTTADERLEHIVSVKPDKDGERELNELSDILARLYRAEERLLASADHLGLTSATLTGVKENIDQGRKLEEKIFHIATLKGYKLQSLDDASHMAEEEGAEFSFTVYDKDQEKLLSAMKLKANELLTAVKEFCSQDLSKQLTLNRTSVLRKLSEKKHDLALFEQQFVKKLHEKKLRDKLKAEVIVLAYLLKNPASLTTKRVNEISDEINKIKWQTFPRFT